MYTVTAAPDRGQPHSPSTAQADLGELLETQLNALLAHIVQVVQRQLPELLAGEEQQRSFRTSVTALLADLIRVLHTGTQPAPFKVPPATMDSIAQVIRDRLAATDIMRAFSLGHRALIEFVGSRFPPETRDTAVGRVTALSIPFMDGMIAAAITDYQKALAPTGARHPERDTQASGPLFEQRGKVVHDLLCGVTLDVEHVEQVLGRRMSGQHRALIAWTEDDTPSDTVRRMVGELIDQLGNGMRPLMLGEPGGQLAVWLTPDGVAMPTRLPDTHHRVRLAVGMPLAGVAGFIRSRQQADLALSVARRTDATVTCYSEVALAALLLRDPASASAFAAEELGRLGAPTDDAAELRDALACYLDLGHDATRTARRLGIHRNTVTAKVTRAESRLGRSAGVRTRELQAALLITEILGESRDSNL